MESTAILQVQDLSKAYRSGGEKLRILDHFSMTMTTGELVAISGPSGIGKTTLLNLIGSLDQPDEGQILLQGRDLGQLSDDDLSQFRARNLGFVFQFHYLLPEFTALENVMLPGRIIHLPPAELQERAEGLLAAVGVAARGEHKPSALSGGERQRVAIARALMNQPALVLADEPTGNLDPDNGERLVELIQHLREEYNQSFLIATHSRTLASACDRILDLRNAEDPGQG